MYRQIPGGPQGFGDFGGESEKAARSVFVGNIPYEATEEQIRDIFNEVGVVLSFRLVYDRETGKPKGYGFCEYKDTDTAMSAMRNLNTRELHGRNLRVDHATRDHGVEKEQSQASVNRSGTVGIGGPVAPPVESLYGPSCNPADAPELISQAINSLPPEQMYKLIKEMKDVIMKNPVEARNMLLQNPQLAYGLLQAQVVMRIVTPDQAIGMLHPKTNTVKAVEASVINKPPPQVAAPAPAPMMRQQPQTMSQVRGDFERSYGHQRSAPPQNQAPPPQMRHDPRQQQSRPQHIKQEPRAGNDDDEKAKLIMQVLQLTPDQINLLPDEQRTSILRLKEQIKSQNR